MNLQSDSEPDRTVQIVSRKMHKNKRTRLLIALCLTIVIILVLIFFLPATGRVSSDTAMRMRCLSLTSWYKQVKSYINESNQVPLSLIEVCQLAFRKGQRPFPPQIVVANDGFLESYPSDLANEPNLFNKEIPFGLFKGSSGWFIRELRPGKVYKKMLMIDQDGRIYEINEVPKGKYSRS